METQRSCPLFIILSHREHTVTGWRNTEDPTESCVILILVWQTRRDFWRRVFFTRILVSWIKRRRERDQKENEKEKEKNREKKLSFSLFFFVLLFFLSLFLFCCFCLLLFSYYPLLLTLCFLRLLLSFLEYEMWLNLKKVTFLSESELASYFFFHLRWVLSIKLIMT